jgi:hypothetical protein
MQKHCNTNEMSFNIYPQSLMQARPYSNGKHIKKITKYYTAAAEFEEGGRTLPLSNDLVLGDHVFRLEILERSPQLGIFPISCVSTTLCSVEYDMLKSSCACLPSLLPLSLL